MNGNGDQNLERIFPKLARAAGVNAKLRIVRSSEVNAWTDGNDVYLTTSLVETLPGEQVAAVIGHELGHIIHRHGERSAEELDKLRSRLYSDNSSTGMERFFAKAIIETALALSTLRRSRCHELEADFAGENLTRKAGFGRGKMSEALDTIGKEHRDKSVFNTHPTTSERTQLLNEKSRRKIRIRIIRKR